MDEITGFAVVAETGESAGSPGVAVRHRAAAAAEQIDTIGWPPGNPAAIYVAALGAACVVREAGAHAVRPAARLGSIPICRVSARARIPA